MTRGLLHKSLRETWRMTLLFGLGLFLFQFIIAYVLGQGIADLGKERAKIESETAEAVATIAVEGKPPAEG